MNKDKNLKKLIWKYFWENKLTELLIGISVIFIPFFLGKGYSLIIPKIMYAKMFGVAYTGTIIQNWIIGMFGLMILGLVALIIYTIIKGNWDWAERRVEEKLKKDMKK